MVLIGHHRSVPSRSYSSPLRERQARQTRDAILATLTELLGEHRADEITTRDLARASGVSERTVYRHFPDREALLAGLSDRLADLSETGAPRAAPDSIDDVPQVAVALMATLDEHHVAARAEALLNADPRRFSAGTRENTEQFHQMLTRELPELDERERVRVAAVMRCLVSAQAWLRMREEFGVPGTESGPTVAWVLQAIIDAIRRGEHPGQPTRPSRQDDSPRDAL